MRRYNLVFIFMAAFIIFSIAIPTFSQETQAPAAKVEAVKAESDAAREFSIYGEVQSVNADVRSMTVQYYDYDSDEEKAAEIISDKETKIENVDDFSKIEKGDWVDVTYMVMDSKNLAKSISVEKEEAQPLGAETMPGASTALPAEY